MIEDYPYVIWAKNSKLGEAYQLRLILETILWALTACLIESLTHIGAFALAIDPKFPNSKLNKISVYTVDVAFYTVEGFA